MREIKLQFSTFGFSHDFDNMRTKVRTGMQAPSFACGNSTASLGSCSDCTASSPALRTQHTAAAVPAAPHPTALLLPAPAAGWLSAHRGHNGDGAAVTRPQPKNAVSWLPTDQLQNQAKPPERRRQEPFAAVCPDFQGPGGDPAPVEVKT